MTATALTVASAGSFAVGLACTLAAPDNVNGNSFVNDGNTFLLVNNTNSTSSQTLVFTMATGPKTLNGVLGTTQTVTLAHSVTSIIGPFPQGYYNNTNGQVVFTASTATNLTLQAISAVETIN